MKSQGFLLRAVGPVLAVALCACSSNEKKPEEEPFDTGPGYPYQIRIEGAPDQTFGELMESALRLYTLADRPPASEARLRRRVEGDLDFVERALRSEGYLLGSVTYDLIPPGQSPVTELPANETQDDSGPADTEDQADAAPKAQVVVNIQSGQRFKLKTLTFEPDAIAGGPSFPTPESLGFVTGEPARGAVVVDAEKKLIRWLHDQGRPYARLIKRRVTAQTRALEMSVLTTIDPGPAVVAGAPDFSGLTSVEQSYLETYMNWEPGERMSRSTLEAYQQRLYGTNLFESVAVTIPPASEDDAEPHPVADGEQVPISVRATESKHRTVGAGVSYSTVDLFGVSGLLEHRNLFGSNEVGRLEAKLALDEQRLAATYEKPQFLVHDQKFVATVEALHEDDDAFTITAYRAFAGIERKLNPRLTFSALGGAEYAEVTDVPIPGISRLILAPVTLDYDGTDNKLDPTRGFKARARVVPAGGTFRDESLAFTTIDLIGSTYWALGDEPQHVIAVRGRLGSLVGASRDSVPAHRRLFSGGGGSIRAYDRRYVGPIDVDGDPLGGRSVAEVSLEFRARIGENLGVVPFIEAGSVSEAEWPDFDEGVQAGAGLGVRYYTPIGPMRADIAFPIDRREVDDAFQFYISIGQAF